MQYPVATDRRTYRNPVYDGYFADPFVLPWQGRYVAYGTGSTVNGRVFEVLESPDLASWSRVDGAMEPLTEELGTDYWAPEVVEADDRFWLYYSVGHGDAGHHLRVAVADHPFGPFVDTGVNLTPAERFAIDPHPFQDTDGTWYLFYARDVLTAARVGTQLAVDTLPSMTALGGNARTVLEATAD
jgi:arabinan endo-1,5-alpha-L-arabinosidase